MFTPERCERSVAAVLEAFGMGKPQWIRRLGGTATPKFAVGLPQGRFVVRVRPAAVAEERMVRFDHLALARLASAGLPVPCPQKTPQGASWITLGADVVEVLSSVEGEPFQEEDLAAVRNVGRFLARFHAALSDDIPPGKEDFIREDQPDQLQPFIPQLRALCRTPADAEAIDRIGRQLELVRIELDGKRYNRLPTAVTHGDIHPGNLRFARSEVAAVYDFDYMSVQARARDLVDGLMFFGAVRNAALDPDDIRSLTQPFRPDLERSAILLSGYAETIRLTDLEWETIPWLMRSQWVQIRLRGSRKVPPEAKVRFVLDPMFDLIDWLDGPAADFFAALRARIGT